MEKCEFHVKTTRKQPFVPEAENDSKTYAFLHGSGAVGRLFAPEWWNSLNSTHFSYFPLILVGSGGNGDLGVSEEEMVPLHEVVVIPSVFEVFLGAFLAQICTLHQIPPISGEFQ